MPELFDNEIRELMGRYAEAAPDPIPLPDPPSGRSPTLSRKPLVAALAGFGVVLLIGAVTLIATNDNPVGAPGDPLDPDTLITSEMILEDGIVTEEEYRAGADAMVACLADAGYQIEAHYDGGGYLGFSGGDTGPLTLEESLDETGPYNTAFDRCFEAHLGDKAFFLRGVQRGEIDPERRAAHIVTHIQCVEERTGKDFGEVTFDSDWFLTQEGEQTHQAAFQEQDEQPWNECAPQENDWVSGWLAGSEELHDLETRSGLDIVQRDGLTLTLRSAPDNPLTLTLNGVLENLCVEVRSANEGAGGCGADLTKPLNIVIGRLEGVSFVNGWAPESAARVVVTLVDGTEVEVTDLVAVEGIDARFFLELLPPTADTEPELPITAVAFDETGGVLTDFILSESNTP